MSNTKDEVKKDVKSTTAKKVDLNTLAALVNETKVSETSSKERNLLYKFQLDEKISSIEQKKKRNSLRKITDKLCFNIVTAHKKLNIAANQFDKKSIEDFLKHYKTNFITNNFTVESVRSKIENEADRKIIATALMICEAYEQK